MATLLSMRMPGQMFCLLALLLWCLSSTLCAEEGRSLTVAPRGSVSEEDLPAEEEQTPAPAEPDASVPTPPQRAAPEVTLPAATAAPALPASTSLSPQDLAALRFVEDGKAALAQEEWEHAQEQFERAVAIAPLQPYAYFFLGRVAFAHGDHRQALAFARKAELLFAQSDHAWRSETADLQGAIYEDLGDYAQARAAYQRCLQLAPANLKALSALARLSEEEPLPRDTLP
ncbi:MAG: tetratricopeptide repeat protein [Deltaproteobacteria bacterium]|nr:tetratricopeptide repeat protein [Deltaproteobacteria bacterium]